MCNGTIISIEYDASGYGHYIIIRDNTTNMGFLYAHLRERPPLTIGGQVTIGQFVGYEGSTGSSTGLHLHLEMQDLTNHGWIFRAPKEYYTNPATFMRTSKSRRNKCNILWNTADPSQHPNINIKKVNSHGQYIQIN